jgi:hypothetical protein
MNRIRAIFLVLLTAFTFVGCNSIPVKSVDEIKNHPKVQIETTVVNMDFDAFVKKLEIEQNLPPLSTARWSGAQPVYILQRISSTEARFIGTGHGNLYGLFEIEPTPDSATQVTSYDWGANSWHPDHKDFLWNW